MQKVALQGLQQLQQVALQGRSMAGRTGRLQGVGRWLVLPHPPQFWCSSGVPVHLVRFQRCIPDQSGGTQMLNRHRRQGCTGLCMYCRLPVDSTICTVVQHTLRPQPLAQLAVQGAPVFLK
jgi:hypothetical protein